MNHLHSLDAASSASSGLDPNKLKAVDQQDWHVVAARNRLNEIVDEVGSLKPYFCEDYCSKMIGIADITDIVT